MNLNKLFIKDYKPNTTIRKPDDIAIIILTPLTPSPMINERRGGEIHCKSSMVKKSLD